jgi:phospholipase C
LLVLLHQCLVLLVEVENLSNTLGSQLGLLGAGEGVVVAGHIGHDGTLIGLDGAVDVFWVQHARDIQVLLSNVKGQVQVVQILTLLQAIVVDKLWTMAMDESTECQTIFEAAKTETLTQWKQ